MSPRTQEPAGAIVDQDDQRAGATAADVVPASVPISICVVAHLAYGALARAGGHIGGVEHQTTQLARWLAARGHRVSMITWDEGQGDGARIDGVVVRTAGRQQDGWPGVRFVHPRWSSLVHALDRADADVYYHNSAEYVTGQVALWCARRRRQFVYSSASNADCDRRLPFLTSMRERVLYRMGLRRAAARIVQTMEQQRMLREGFGLSSVVIPMPAPDLSGIVSTGSGREGPHGSVLWIGRICAIKRPDRLLALAAACPQFSFELIGPSDGTAYAEDVLCRARQSANVHVRGALTRLQVAEALGRAWCLCCTSEIEGFPNTFLEAWSQSVPVLSTVDPDGVIGSHSLGWSVPDVERMADRLVTLSRDPALWHTASSNARRYYLQTHTEEAVMPRFEAVLVGAVRGPS